IFVGMAKVFHVLARDRDGTYSAILVRDFAADRKNCSREKSITQTCWLVCELLVTMAPSSPALTPPQEKRKLVWPGRRAHLFPSGEKGAVNKRSQSRRKNNL
ncbi:MAG: hypothetical protein ACKOU6_06095, partial [Planctomycetota bacterium]